MKKPLDGVVALITGASRGVGKGVALGLAEYGAVTYITGRNEETLNATAAEIEALGVSCYPLRCDHTDDSQAARIFQEIASKNHRISILVNSVWGGYENMIENGAFTWGNPFWDQPVWRWKAMFDAGVRAAFIASKFAVKDMIDSKNGLIVNISHWAAQKRIGNIIYGAAKAATDKLSHDMSQELRDKGVCVISLYPGLVRTELVMAASQYFNLSNSESPQFIGRVVAGLHIDHNKMLKTGQVWVAATLAQEYGIADIDGKRIRPLTLENCTE